MANSNVSVGYNGTHDIKLQDKPTSPDTVVGLVLQRNRGGRLSYIKEALESFSPPRRSGPLSFSDIHSSIELVHSQNDWSGGALQPVYSPQHPNRYAEADGMDMRWKNVMATGMQLEGPVDFLVRNGGAEAGATTGWTAGDGATLSVVSTTSRTGKYSFRLASAAANHDLRQTLANGAVYRSRAITVYAYVKRGPTGSATARVQVVDTTTTSGTGVSLTENWQLISVTRTVSSTATTLSVHIDLSAAASTPDVYVDDIFIVPAGGVECAGVAVGRDNLAFNGGAEINDTTGWTTTGAGAAFSSATTVTANEGSRHWQLTDTTSAGTITAYWTIPNPENYRGKTLILTGAARNANVDHFANIFITDSAGTTHSTANELITWEPLSVSRTINTGATFLRVGIRRVGTAAAGNTAYFDSLVASVANMDVVYGAFGRMVCQWNETDRVWVAVYIAASQPATDIIQYKGLVYVAYGNGDNAYLVGSGTSWNPSVITGDAKYAHFFAVSRSTLWKTRYDGDGLHAYVASSTNAKTGGSWSGEVTVGDEYRPITGIYDFNDSLAVGKEDGIHVYNRVANHVAAADTWRNISNEFRNFIDSANFAIGEEYRNELYLTASQQNLFRWNGSGTFEDLTFLFFNPRDADFGGKIRAMTFCATQLWLLVDTPSTDQTDAKETWLMSLREDEEGFHLHTAQKVGIGDISRISAYDRKLWALGRVYDTNIADYRAAIYRWEIPDKTIAPFADATPAIYTGTARAVMSRMDWNLPTETKAFISVEVFCDRSVIDADHTLTVKYRLDEGDVVTLGAVTHSDDTNYEVLHFSDVADPEDNAVGKSIQLIFESTTDDAIPVQVWAYKLTATYQPKPVDVVECRVLLQNNGRTANGAGIDPDTKAAKVAALATLRDQPWPLVITEDIDQDNVPETWYGHIQRDSIRRRPELENPDDAAEVWSFRLIRVEVA